MTILPGQDQALSRLRGGSPVFGVAQLATGPLVTELAVWCGFDFVMLDCEHGVVDEAAQIASLQVIAGSSAFSAVRVRPADFLAVSRYLDFGADAVLLPDVRTADDAAAFVSASQTGPRGARSSSGHAARATRYGLAPAKAPAPPLLLAMVESAEAVANIEAIASTPLLGGIVVGHNDLSADLGCPGDFAAPQDQAALAVIERAAALGGVLLGGSPYPGHGVDSLVGRGYRFVLAGSDILALREGFQARVHASQISGLS